jgi:hypothetical protein
VPQNVNVAVSRAAEHHATARPRLRSIAEAIERFLGWQVAAVAAGSQWQVVTEKSLEDSGFEPVSSDLPPRAVWVWRPCTTFRYLQLLLQLFALPSHHHPFATHTTRISLYLPTYLPTHPPTHLQLVCLALRAVEFSKVALYLHEHRVLSKVGRSVGKVGR